MTTSIGARPLTEADVPIFTDLDETHSQTYGIDQVLTTASGRFFQRDGYSFVTDSPSGRGFVIAQGLFNGHAAQVQIRVAAADGNREVVLRALFQAVAKAAYDSGVYELTATLPTSDEVAARAIENTMFVLQPHTVFRRLLGSRATIPGEEGDDS